MRPAQSPTLAPLGVGREARHDLARMLRSAATTRRAAARHVTIFGCGLIGGSLAKAVRLGWPKSEITAVDRPRVLEAALQHGSIDQGRSIRAALAELRMGRPVDIVVLALPVNTILELLPAVSEAARRHPRPPLILDVASVKAPVMELAARCETPRFFGGHPLAGLETPGFEASSPDLFRDRPFVLCPGTPLHGDLTRVRTWIRGLGARPLVLAPDVHDQIVAVTSHLPHVVAWTLMQLALDLPAHRDGLPWSLAAGSWRDATRVAAASPELWNGILHQNRAHVVAALDRWIVHVQALRDALARGESQPLTAGSVGIEGKRVARVRRRIRARLPRGG